LSKPDNTIDQHYQGLDLLRACAILMVIASHATYLFLPAWPDLARIAGEGWVGVDLFFVLSGFLIGTQIFRQTAASGKIDFGRFYFRRAMRIFPAYFFVLLIYKIWATSVNQPVMQPLWTFVLFFRNYGNQNTAFDHAWSLSLEEHFYLIFPLAVYWCNRAANPKRLAILVIMGLITGIIGLRFYLWSQSVPFLPHTFRNTHTRLDGLIFGVVLALVRVKRKPLWDKLSSHPLICFIFGMGFLLLVTMGFSRAEQFWWAYSFGFTLLALAFAFLLISATSPKSYLTNWRIPGIATLARMAYPLYLVHPSMLLISRKIVAKHHLTLELHFLLAILLCGLAASILHYVVERPFLHLRDSLLARKS
jgi:peptidoglycan/LPS O-acetylase OafA/YrhL